MSDYYFLSDLQTSFYDILNYCAFLFKFVCLNLIRKKNIRNIFLNSIIGCNSNLIRISGGAVLPVTRKQKQYPLVFITQFWIDISCPRYQAIPKSINIHGPIWNQIRFVNFKQTPSDTAKSIVVISRVIAHESKSYCVGTRSSYAKNIVRHPMSKALYTYCGTNATDSPAFLKRLTCRIPIVASPPYRKLCRRQRQTKVSYGTKILNRRGPNLCTPCLLSHVSLTPKDYASLRLVPLDNCVFAFGDCHKLFHSFVEIDTGTINTVLQPFTQMVVINIICVSFFELNLFIFWTILCIADKLWGIKNIGPILILLSIDNYLYSEIFIWYECFFKRLLRNYTKNGPTLI